MIHCPSCNKEMQIENGNLFCPKCGISLPTDWLIDTAFLLSAEQLGLNEEVKPEEMKYADAEEMANLADRLEEEPIPFNPRDHFPTNFKMK